MAIDTKPPAAPELWPAGRWTTDPRVTLTTSLGKVVIDLKDIDGKEFVRERVELGKSKASFWQEYKFTDPMSKKIEPKQRYCERLDETVVCGGVYKPN